MNRRWQVNRVLLVLAVSTAVSGTLAAENADAKPGTGSSGGMVPVLEEFDNVHRNGKWDVHQYRGTFQYHVKPDALIMVDRENRNQHVTRRGLLLDPQRQYAVEASFTINEPPNAPLPNSFCLNFNIAGSEGQLDSISCWSINVDVLSSDPPRGVIKHMGFVNGRFRQIGERRLDWCKTNVEYRLRVDVNADMQGRYKLKTLTVTVTQGDVQRERFEVDYSRFPYQPDLSKPVRIGANTHGADWTMRKLKVYAPSGSVPAAKQ